MIYFALWSFWLSFLQCPLRISRRNSKLFWKLQPKKESFQIAGNKSNRVTAIFAKLLVKTKTASNFPKFLRSFDKVNLPHHVMFDHTVWTWTGHKIKLKLVWVWWCKNPSGQEYWPKSNNASKWWSQYANLESPRKIVSQKTELKCRTEKYVSAFCSFLRSDSESYTQSLRLVFNEFSQTAAI